MDFYNSKKRTKLSFNKKNNNDNDGVDGSHLELMKPRFDEYWILK